MTRMRKLNKIITVMLLSLAVVILAFPLDTQATNQRALGYFNTTGLEVDGILDSTSSVNSLVLLIEFNDVRNESENLTPENLSEHYFENQPTEVNPYGSLTYYYEESSNGNFKIDGDVYDWYTAPNNKDYYKNDDNLEMLIVDALVHNINENDLEISDYDSDGDMVLDAVFVQFAGGYDDYFTDYTTSFDTNKLTTIDGYSFDSYVSLVSTKLSKIIHETGHLLGIPDLYYSDENSSYFGIGGLDMMDGAVGDHNAFTKLSLDWSTLVEFDPNKQIQTVSLEASYKNNQALLIPAIDPETKEPIYYLVEYLLPEGLWNFDLAYQNIYHGGLRIFKINPTLTKDGTEFLYSDNSLISLVSPISSDVLLSTDSLYYEGNVRLQSHGGNIRLESIRLEGDSISFTVNNKSLK